MSLGTETRTRFLTLKAWQQALILLAVNVILIAALLVGFEQYLRWIDPRRKLPFRGIDENGDYITWGHRVIVNQYGFRERDFAVPKPPGVCRVMVLGDSFTWGTGLSIEERYTNLTEKQLNQLLPGRTFEVLNFAQEGLPTVVERDILLQYHGQVGPDLIVVAFYLDDTQPRGYTYRIEREHLYEKYRLTDLIQILRAVGLVHIGEQLERAVDITTVELGIVPTIEEGLQRTYEEDSQEWQAFTQALADIKAVSDELGLPPPYFAVLNDTRNLVIPTYYDTPDDQVDIYRRWFHQAERVAIDAGFRTFNYEHELVDHPFTPINELDGHPSASVNEMYAEKLSGKIISDIENQYICPID